jgi:hypothetical protein
MSLGRIRNGHAHGLNDPQARLHGGEGLVLVVDALTQIVRLYTCTSYKITEHRAVALMRNDTEPSQMCVRNFIFKSVLFSEKRCAPPVEAFKKNYETQRGP